VFLFRGTAAVALSRVFSFSDPSQCKAVVRSADLEIFPTAKGSFHAEIARIGMPRLPVQRFHISRPQIDRLFDQTHFVTVPALWPRRLAGRQPRSKSSALAHPASQRRHTIMPAAWPSTALINGSAEATHIVATAMYFGNALLGDRRVRSVRLGLVTADFFCLRKAGNALE
jgi:hypothetical protein